MQKDDSNYKMLVAYDGTDYGGWQIQPNAKTIQEVLQNAVQTITRHPVTVIGSGRTDAGVHATGQTANFTTPGELDLYRFLGSLNALLPHSIRILHIEKTESEFHSQYCAKGKIYHYHLWLDRVQDPFKRLYSYHVREKIDKGFLLEAARKFVGTHDFSAFANEAHRGVAAYDAIRTIVRVDVVPQEGGVRIEYEADGFLYKMVRNITGTLLEVAAGKRSLDDIERIFDTKDRREAGKTAPPHGLFLVKVLY